MSTDREIQDVETFGRSTQYEVVKAQGGDERGWLSAASSCDLLRIHHIAHVGRMWAKPPFEVIRAEASGTFVLVGLEGRGETLVDGKWRGVKAGEICLLPAFAHTGIRATNKKAWRFAWVRYEESRETSPVLSSSSPLIHAGQVHTLDHAIAGLHIEAGREIAEPAMLSHWVELIHGFVSRAARPYQGDDRLWRIWEEVEKHLARDWKLKELADMGTLSPEHLRRLCQQQLGRSPIQQVTYLRMRRAVHLLTTTHDKIATIAQAVGYENPFAFSNAFKRWTGRRPSSFREEA